MLIAKAPLVLIIGGLMSTGTLQAQTTETTENAEVACIDVDGDGYGWTGTESCRVPGFVAVAGECLDFDGDGYGWNGVETCLIPGFIPTAGACIDFDNDGFGWNGVETCFIDEQPPVTEEETSQPPTDEVPDSPLADDSDVNDAAILAFEEQLEGVRSYGCVPGVDGFLTSEFVEVFSNGLTTFDFWLYEDDTECVTRPITETTVLPIFSYVLERPFITADGREAFEFQTEVQQLSSVDGFNVNFANFPEGTVLFDIIAVEQGGVVAGTTLSSTPEDRPTELLEPFGSPQPVGIRAEPASIQGLINTWQAECFQGREQQREFNEQNLIETISFYDDDDCAADRFRATRVNTWNITYGDPVTTVFGQPALRTTTELVDSQFSDLVIDSSLPPPPPLSQIGLVFEDIWGVIDNELVIGTCLDKRPDNCGVADNIPDIMNFNVGNRFVKQ